MSFKVNSSFIEFNKTFISERYSGDKGGIESSVLINGRLTFGKVFTPKQLGGSNFHHWNDPLQKPLTSDDIQSDFQKDFVVYLVTKTKACDLYKVFNINGRNNVIKLAGEPNGTLSGFVSNRQDRKFALEINNQPVSMCSLTVHTVIMKRSFFHSKMQIYQLSLSANNIDEEMLLQSKVDLLHIQGLQEMERFWQEINFQTCRFQDVDTTLKTFLISKLDSATNGDEMVGTPFERSTEVVYLQRCAKMENTLATSDLCTEKPL